MNLEYFVVLESKEVLKKKKPTQEKTHNDEGMSKRHRSQS